VPVYTATVRPRVPAVAAIALGWWAAVYLPPLLAGRTLNTGVSSFGIVILAAGSELEARRVMLGDPAVAQRVMRAELYPFRIALLGTLL